MHFRRLLYLLPLICLVVLGCAQRETDIGSNAVTGVPENSFIVVSGTATHSRDWHPPFTNGGGTSLQIGDAKNLYAFTAIRFNASTNLPDSVQVDSLTIRLCRASTWPGGMLPGIQVRIREIPDSVTWTQGALLPGTFPGRESYPIIDSLVVSGTDSFFTFSLQNPQETFSRWHRDSLNHGLIIEPRTEVSGGTGGFIEFYSLDETNADHPEFNPALLIHGRALVNDTTFSPDSTHETFATDDGYLVLDSTDIANPAAHVGRLIITQGMPQRAAVFFPLDTIMSNFTRAVTRAELRLYPDTTNPLRIPLPGATISLNHGFLKDSIWISHPDSLTLNRVLGPEAGTEGNGSWSRDNSYVAFDVTNAVGAWILNTTPNSGLQVFAANELDNLAREVFYGADADSATLYNKRPKLFIWYTEISH